MNKATRRSFLHAAGLTSAAVSGLTRPAGAETAGHGPAAPHAQPLAQDYVVVTRTADKRICTCGPGLVKLADGDLFATVPFWPQNARELSTEVRTARSGDGGRTWEALEPLPYFTACGTSAGWRSHIGMVGLDMSTS